MPLSQEDIDFLRSKGIDPSQVVEDGTSAPEGMSQGRAVGATLKAHAGSILGGGGGTLAGALAGEAIFPPGGGIPGAFIGAIGGGLGGGYLGSKAQQAVVPADVEEKIQAEAEQAKLEHPYTTLATDVGASALASGGKFSPGALFRGLRGDTAALSNIALQSGVNTAIDTGVNLATTGHLPSAHDFLGDVVGGSLFSEPSSLGRMAHRTSSDPIGEPNADLQVEPSITEQTVGPLNMTVPEPLSSEAPPKTKDTTTQNTMDQTRVSENPIDKKAAVESPVVTEAGESEEDLRKQLSEAMGEEMPVPVPKTGGREALTYSPEDLQSYNDLKQKMTDMSSQMGSPEFNDVWKQFEQVRNKYNGMPPKVEAVKPVEEVQQKPTVEPEKPIPEQPLIKGPDVVVNEPTKPVETIPSKTSITTSKDNDFYMGKVGRLTRDVISRVHDIPRADAKQLADVTKQSLNEQDRLSGQLRNSTIQAGKKMNGHDLEMINKVMDKENTTGTLHREMLDSDAQRSFYDTVKKNMSDSGDYAIKNSIPVASDKGPRPLKKDPSHWPSMTNDKVSDVYRSGDLDAIKVLDKKFDEWNQTKVGLTPDGSAKVIKDWKTAIQGSVRNSDVSHQDYFKAFRRAMGTPIPPEFREPNPVKNMSRYFDRASIALSHYKYIESNPQVMATLGATHDAWGKPIAPNPDGSLANNQQVKDLLKQFHSEKRGTGDDTESSLSSLFTGSLISGPTIESHKLISNAVGAVNLSDNAYQLSRALAHGLANVKQGYQHAVENGLTKLTATSTLDMFNGSLSSAQRMNGVGKLIRDVSTLGGLTTKANLGFMQSYFEYLVPSKIARANAGDMNARMFMRRLDPSFQLGKKYSPIETSQYASQAAGYIHGTGDIRSLPAWMMNDSEVSGFFKLAHWSVSQTNNFMHNVWTPAAKGNYKPLMTSVFGATVGGYIIKQLREELQGKKSGIPSLTEIAGSDRGLAGNSGPLAYNAIAAMQYSGFGGLLSQIAKYPFDFVYKNIPQGATFPLDQIATDMAKTVGQVTSAIANDPNLKWVDLAKAVTGHILQNDMQLSRIAINQGINAGLITGLPAEKKALGDKMGELRRFDMVEGLPYNDIDQTSNPFMNIEQQKFKHNPDLGESLQMLPSLITNIIDRYSSKPDVMMSKLKALKENSYDTMPSLDTMPMQFFKYMAYIQRTRGNGAAEDAVRDYLTHKVVNQAKGSVVP